MEKSIALSKECSLDVITESIKQLKQLNDYSPKVPHKILAIACLTALIQSSTATTGIMMGFLAAGTLNLDTGVAIVLGANIGTCFDSWLASLGSGRDGKLTAYSQIWLNVIGVAFFSVHRIISNDWFPFIRTP